MRSRSRLVRRLFAGAALLAALSPERMSAISQPLQTSGLPWGDRVAREGLELRVAVEPVDGPGGGALRARDRVAFRFRISDESGRPIRGLRPEAWMEPLESGEAVDPAACVQEMETDAGWSLVRTPSLDLPLQESSRPGTYEAVARLGRPGRYEVAFFLGSPRLVHCFEVEIRPAGRLGAGS